MNFCEWVEINEIKAPKKAKIAAVTHSDIDRWLKSVDGFAKDLQDLKKAKEKSQSKLAQIKKKYEPEKQRPKKPEDQEDKKATEKDSQPLTKQPVVTKPIESPDEREQPSEREPVVKPLGKSRLRKPDRKEEE